jgi:hypothetical protein
MDKVFGAIAFALFAVGLLLIIALLMALPVMWTVNYVFSDAALIAVFGAPAIGFWKALWLNFVCGILFKSSSRSSSSS